MESHAVEAREPRERAEPEVTVARLQDRRHPRMRKAIIFGIPDLLDVVRHGDLPVGRKCLSYREENDEKVPNTAQPTKNLARTCVGCEAGRACATRDDGS